MRRLLLACLLGCGIGLSGCFAPKIDLSGLDNLVKVHKDDSGKDKDKEKKDKDKKKDD